MKIGRPEKSIVTVVAFDVVDSTSAIAGLDPDDAEVFLDQIYIHCKSVIEAEGGMLASFAGDGGIAIFGWPRSMEDHAARACHAAWSIHQEPSSGPLPGRPDGNPVQFRVGIHSGLVGLRQIEFEDGLRLDLVGGTVHLAASLEKHAPATKTLVSSHTLDLCHSPPNSKIFGDIPLLKKIGASACIVEERPDTSSTPQGGRKYDQPMVGRTREMDTLLERLELSSKSVSTVAIIGEPGIGKSRLATAASDQATILNEQLRVMKFSGDPRLASAAFSIPRDILAHLTSQNPSVTTRLIENSRSKPAAKILFGPARDANAGNLAPNEVGRTFAELLEALVQDQPTLLVIEDLHFIDPDSRVCLQFINSIKAGLKIIITARPEAEDAANMIVRSSLTLKPMSRKDMLTLAGELIETDDRKEISAAVDRADGIPLHIEQIALSLREGTGTSATPQSIQSLVHARLNSLPAKTKSHAQTLSVVGEYVKTDLACDVLGVSKSDIGRELETLQGMSILDTVDDKVIKFCHAIIADACRATVTGKRRREIHFQAIEFINSHAEGKPEELYQLAHHAEAADDNRLAMEYLWSAALQARKSGADRTLDLIFDKAIELSKHGGTAGNFKFVDFVLLATAVLLQLGEFEKVRQHLPTALQIADSLKLRDKVCAAMCHLGMIDWFDGNYSKGIAESEEALAISEELKSLPLKFAAQMMLAFNLHSIGRVDKSILLLDDLCRIMTGALENAKLGGPGIQGPIARAFLSWHLLDKGDVEKSLTELNKAHTAAKKANDAYAQIICLHAMGRSDLFLGKNESAVSCMEANLELIERSGYDAIVPHVTGFYATALTRCGRPEDALNAVEAVLTEDLAKRTGVQELFQLYCGYGEALFVTGTHKRGQKWVAKAVNLADTIENPFLQIQGLGLRAMLTGRLDPENKLVAEDLQRQSELSQRFGLKAWA